MLQKFKNKLFKIITYKVYSNIAYNNVCYMNYALKNQYGEIIALVEGYDRAKIISEAFSDKNIQIIAIK